jgi:hypothetical protein
MAEYRHGGLCPCDVCHGRRARRAVKRRRQYQRAMDLAVERLHAIVRAMVADRLKRART